MIDGGLAQLFKKNLKRGWHWQQVETLIGTGVPDLNFCCNGVEGWIENKLTSTNRINLKKEQVAWLMSRAARGGNVFVAVRHKHSGGKIKGPPVDELWIFDGRDSQQLRKNGLTGVKALLVERGGPAKWDWEKVARVLTTRAS